MDRAVDGWPVDEPSLDGLITEDDEPLDSFAQEKNQRLLADALHSSWAGPKGGRTYLAATNVGIFASPRSKGVVPDLLISLDVEIAADWWSKKNRSYLVWEFEKVPDLVLEIVSNRKGCAAGDALAAYGRLRIPCYVVYDPQRLLRGEKILRVFELRAGDWVERRDQRVPRLGLELTLWEGEFEGHHATWLRWMDSRGRLLWTGKERAEAEAQRAADAEERLARLEAQLRVLGVEPDVDR